MRSRNISAVAFALALGGACEANEKSGASEQAVVAKASDNAESPPAEPAAPEEAEPHADDHATGAANGVPVEGGRLFGKAFSAEVAMTSLDAVVAEPAKFEGQVVKTEGTIERVCQKMGCWMELKCDAGSVRVPMAGHSFFLPKDSAGKRATVEGRVGLQELSKDAQEHLKAEGAQQVAALHIAATGVLIR